MKDDLLLKLVSPSCAIRRWAGVNMGLIFGRPPTIALLMFAVQAAKPAKNRILALANGM